MEANDRTEIQKMIDAAITKVTTYQVRKLGDTPTDSFQLTPKNYVDHRVTGGFVTSSGAAGVPFPVGWGASVVGTGAVRVTRTVDPNTLAKYAVVATPLSATAFFATVNNHGKDSFDINTFNAAGSAAASDVYFIVSAVY